MSIGRVDGSITTASAPTEGVRKAKHSKPRLSDAEKAAFQDGVVAAFKSKNDPLINRMLALGFKVTVRRVGGYEVVYLSSPKKVDGWRKETVLSIVKIRKYLTMGDSEKAILWDQCATKIVNYRKGYEKLFAKELKGTEQTSKASGLRA